MSLLKYLYPKNWSRYSRRFSGDKDGLRKYKRVILLSQFMLFGTVIGVLHALEDLIDGLFFMPMMDLIMAVALFVCYVINESGKHKLARIVTLSFLNLFFFVYSSLANHELGIYLYYFSWVGLAAVVFEVHENFYRFFFIALSVVLAITLFVTDFNIFGETTFEARDLARSFIINFVSSILVLTFFIVFMVNVNEQSEKKLIDLTQEIKEKNVELIDANNELDRFFYSTSHDLKVPLMDIRGILSMALSEQHNERVLNYFLLLKERTDKLDDFLKEVIEYSRNAKTIIKIESVNMHVLVADVIGNFKFVNGADKIQFHTNLSIDRYVELDRIRFLIVLNNLLSNAVKYHRHDIRNPYIRISANVENGILQLIVADNGQGISEDVLPKIFNMFFRGTNQSKGSGLGLYIVKETLDRIRGVITVRSTIQVGSTFTVEIPVKVGEVLPVEKKDITQPTVI